VGRPLKTTMCAVRREVRKGGKDGGRSHYRTGKTTRSCAAQKVLLLHRASKKKNCNKTLDASMCNWECQGRKTVESKGLDAKLAATFGTGCQGHAKKTQTCPRQEEERDTKLGKKRIARKRPTTSAEVQWVAWRIDFKNYFTAVGQNKCSGKRRIFPKIGGMLADTKPAPKTQHTEKGGAKNGDVQQSKWVAVKPRKGNRFITTQ